MQAQTQTAVNAYSREQHLNLSPVQVIYRLYDYAIMGCKKEDPVLAQRALNELILALDFNQKEIALGLFRLYDYCKGCVQKQQYQQSIEILEELRTTWAQAFHLS